MRMFVDSAGMQIDWADLSGKRLDAPFFDDAVRSAFAQPYPLLFRHVTPVDVLAEFADPVQLREPTGFIFHLSRCGSTLLAQMLASAVGNVVISEASVVRAMLRRTAGLAPADRATWLRGLISALGRPRNETDERFFVKFEASQITELPLIRQAFPDVPWVFLYRDPVDVLVSLERLGGADLLPGVIDPALLGISRERAVTMPSEEYNARILAMICRAALEHHDPLRARLVNYRDLPDAAWTEVADLFGLELTNESLQCMRARSVRRGKQSGVAFADDTAEKRSAATPAIHAAADGHVRALFDQLEALRTGAGGAA